MENGLLTNYGVWAVIGPDQERPKIHYRNG